MQEPLTLHSLFQSLLSFAYMTNKVFVAGAISDHLEQTAPSNSTLQACPKKSLCPNKYTHILVHAQCFAETLNRDSGTSSKIHLDPGPSLFRLLKLPPLNIKNSMYFFLHS